MLYHVIADDVTVNSGEDKVFSYDLQQRKYTELVVGYSIRPSGSPTSLGGTNIGCDFGNGFRVVEGVSHQTYEVSGVVDIPLSAETITAKVYNSGQDSDVVVNFEVVGKNI